MQLKLCLVLIFMGLSANHSTDRNKLKNVLTLLKTDYVKNFRKNFFEDVEINKKGVNRKHVVSQNFNFRANDDEQMKPLKSKVRSKVTNIQGEKKKQGSLSSSQESSSRDEKDWKVHWEAYWLKKKYDVLNTTQPKGEVMNMVGARPWGVSCGDPNQHDMPWGTCMLAMECEPDLRIYRGDYLCGRTEFACCGFQLTTYDLNQANDEISMESKGMSQDEQEDSTNNKKERDRKKKSRDKQKVRRKVDQLNRKKKIRQKIKEIMQEINKLMDKMFKNQTRTKSKKTKDLKRFLKKLKKQYKADRVALLDLHNELSIKIDAGMMLKLNQVRDMNENFVQNATFRDLLINGTVNNKQARMLVEAYPEMYRYLPRRVRSKDMLRKSRRSGGNERQQIVFNDYPYEDVDYDIEYGYLYY